VGCGGKKYSIYIGVNIGTSKKIPWYFTVSVILVLGNLKYLGTSLYL
jgi:hypothetical protein